MYSLATLLTPLKEQPSVLQDCMSPLALPGKPPPRRRALCRMHGKIWMAHKINFAASKSKVLQATAVELLPVENQVRLHLARCWGVGWAALAWW